jgi:type VI protein secretion system component VasK
MLVIVGLIILLAAAIVSIVGVLSNTGAAHPLTENFSVFGYHVTGSTGSLFLFGIVVGAVALLGLSVLLAGARRTAGRGRDARLEHQQRADTATAPTVNSDEGATPRRRSPLLGRWSRVRQPVSTGQSNGHHSRGL